MRWSSAAAMVLALGAFGCDGQDATGDAAPAVDAAVDRGLDGGLTADMAVDPDGAPDPDAAADMAPDTMPDAMADAMPDAMPDAMVDAMVDAMPDAMVPDPLEEGRALYDLYCAFCHGADGEGYISDNANALSNQQFLATVTDELLVRAIERGRPGTAMPGLGEIEQGPLSEADVDAIVAYIRTWQLEPSRADVHDLEIDGLAARGRPIYNAACAGCHGDEGEGAEYMSVANPWFLETASDGYIRAAIAEGRPGTVMNAYGDRLTPQQLDDVTALIRSWQVPVDGTPVPVFEPDVEGGTLNPDGDDPEFELRDGRFVSMIDVAAALDAGQRLFILDARTRADYFRERIADSVSLPHFDLEPYLDRLPRDVWIVAYCGCPHAISGQAFDILAAEGFERIAVLDEGFYAWRDAGYPVASGEPGEPEE